MPPADTPVLGTPSTHICSAHAPVPDTGAESVNVWTASIQPPGLMKMRLMHLQEHHQGHQAHCNYL